MNEVNIQEFDLSENSKIKEKNKPEEKTSITKRKHSLVKECEVLVYNKKTCTAIISFDGFGYEITGILNNPGNKILVKYVGDIHSPNFKIEVDN